MDSEQIERDMQEIFDNVFLDKVVIRRNLNAKEVPEWDSLLHISLVVAVEEHFKIRFRTGEIEGTNNVGEFMDLIGRHLQRNK